VLIEFDLGNTWKGATEPFGTNPPTDMDAGAIGFMSKGI